MLWDGVEVKPVSGEPITAQKESTDFSGQCNQCGCEFGQLVCTKPDCDGCTIEIESETCRHAFTHRVCNPAVNRDVRYRWQPFSTMSFRKLARGKGDQLDPGTDGADRLHHETISHTFRVLTPDADQPVYSLHHGQFIAQHSHSQDDSPSLVGAPASVAEAGRATSLPGGGRL